jgi:hypothetical protein
MTAEDAQRDKFVDASERHKSRKQADKFAAARMMFSNNPSPPCEVLLAVIKLWSKSNSIAD